MDTQPERTENWEGEWLTNTNYIVTVAHHNMVIKVNAPNGTTLTGLIFNAFVDSKGNSSYGKLMHKKRGEEDLRKRWNKQ